MRKDPIRGYSIGIGVVIALLGVMGFMPGLLYPPEVNDFAMMVNAGYGRLLGLFPTNALGNIMMIMMGIWGMVAGKDLAASTRFTQFAAWFFGVVALMGLIPGLNTVFGLIPLFGHNIWKHLILARVAAYAGYRSAVRTRDVPVERIGEGSTRRAS
jgi:hypothetical protein